MPYSLAAARRATDVVAATGVFIVVVALGCTDSDVASQQGPLLEAGLAAAEMISVDHNDYIRGFRFPPGLGLLESSGPLLLDGDYVLDFVPLADTRGGSVRLRVVDSSEELLVREFPVTPIREYGTDFERRSKALANPARIDLSPLRNRSVRMLWTFQGPSSSGAAVAGVKLRRKDRGGDERPDILLVCSDTHRFDYAMGQRGRRLMPRLDRLASDSVVYLRAYSPASWTLPSIASTLTGLLPRRHLTGHRSKGRFAAKAPPSGHLVFKDQLISTYPAEIKTVAERLRNQGYTTVLVSGNWFHFGSGLFADGQDFALGGVRWRSVVLANDASAGGHPSPGSYLDDGASLNHKALSMLRELSSEDPLFMIVHYMDVHDWSNRLDVSGTPTRRSKLRGTEAYADQVRNVDRYLSELLEVWSSKRGYEQSMIVFLADHGEHLFDPGQPLYHGHTMDDALIHVPLVVKYPKSLGVRPRATSRAVSLVDLAPTVLDLVGATWSAEDFDGVSLLDATQQETTRTLFADYQLFGDERSSVRRGPMKLVINLSRGTEHLVDLRKPYTAEAGERGQIVENAEIQESLRNAFQTYARESRDRTRGVRSRHKVGLTETLEQLRSLGYLD